MADEKFIKWTDFGKLETSEELERYLACRKHEKYYHYTRVECADEIIKNMKFLISDVSALNDNVERKCFNHPKYRFAASFSTGKNENLALWYLYSGMDGKGCRMEFTETTLYDILGSDVFLEDSSGNSMKLIPDKTVKISFGDVVYYRYEKNGFCQIKYNTMMNVGKMPEAEFEKYKKKHKGFFKDVIWYYEKEFRIVFEILGEARDFADKFSNCRICLKFPEKLKHRIGIRLAPETSLSELKKKDLKALSEISDNISESDHKGKIKMNLCRKCNSHDKEKQV